MWPLVGSSSYCSPDPLMMLSLPPEDSDWAPSTFREHDWELKGQNPKTRMLLLRGLQSLLCNPDSQTTSKQSRPAKGWASEWWRAWMGKGFWGWREWSLRPMEAKWGGAQMEVPEGQGWLRHPAPGDGNWAAALGERLGDTPKPQPRPPLPPLQTFTEAELSAGERGFLPLNLRRWGSQGRSRAERLGGEGRA